MFNPEELSEIYTKNNPEKLVAEKSQKNATKNTCSDAPAGIV